jgi:hypothetical protein
MVYVLIDHYDEDAGSFKTGKLFSFEHSECNMLRDEKGRRDEESLLD